jgi:predicted MPP superfamily phosphohydrolase
MVSTLFGACLLLVQGCARSPAVFQHDLSPPPSPWSGKAIESSVDKFTFAIFSDLNGGEREGIFNVAVAQLKQLRPDFIVSVGDLIEGESEDEAQLLKEWDSFDKRAERAGAPIFRVGGNHDLSNVTMWEMWSERYGPRYYYFIYRHVLFLILDS